MASLGARAAWDARSERVSWVDRLDGMSRAELVAQAPPGVLAFIMICIIHGLTLYG